MLPPIAIVVSVEMIRDGGSLAASFCGPHGDRWWLLLKIRMADLPTGERGRVGYSEPVALDRLTGVEHALSWTQAGILLRQMKPMLSSDDARFWFAVMERVVSTEGELPPQVPPDFAEPSDSSNHA